LTASLNTVFGRGLREADARVLASAVDAEIRTTITDDSNMITRFPSFVEAYTSVRN